MKQQDPPFLPPHPDPPSLPPRAEHTLLPPHEDLPLLPPHEEPVLLPSHKEHPRLASDDAAPGQTGQTTTSRSGTGTGDTGDEKQGREGDGGNGKLSTMEQLLDRIERAVHDGEEKVTLEAILDEVGRRSFGPLLLLAGVVTLMPILGDIPGVPSIMGILVILTALQLLVQRDHFWLPQWLLRRKVSRGALCKGLGWMRKPARFLDRLLKPRIPWLVKGPGFALIAAVCLLIGLMLPPMEFVPFSANGAGLALTIFGLAIIARDGAAALLGLTITGSTLALVTMGLL